MINLDECTFISEKAVLASKGYTLIKKLNSGTFANVYLAEYKSNEDSTNHDIRACKIINLKKKTLKKKFIHRELDILTKLHHPYLISIHGILHLSNKYYIFMPYAENGDLLEYIVGFKEMIPEEQCRIWFRQLSLGIQYIHEMDIAHRDIKCENILLTSEMNIKLADFGFACYVSDENGKEIFSCTYCGSINYLAPEVLIGSSPYSPKISDMWSMGVILFIMLNKSMPFKVSDVPMQMYQNQMERRYKFKSKRVNLISQQPILIVTNLLEPNVATRWTINEVLQSEWFTMEPKLNNLSTEEQEALNCAITHKCRKDNGQMKNTEENQGKRNSDNAITSKETTDNDNIEETEVPKEVSQNET